MSNSLPTATTPPPNLLLQKCENKIQTSLNKKHLLQECLWALEHPELQKACFLARICADKPPVKCELLNISGILQVGPTCGLTALSMLLGGKPAAEQLLQEAQQKHFTNNGEMFSAHNLYELICDNLYAINNDDNNNTTQSSAMNDNDINTDRSTKQATTKHKGMIQCQMHKGRLNCAKVREYMQQGACAFVPYPFIKNILKRHYEKY